MHSPDVCNLKENFHCHALTGKPTNPQTIRLIIECNTKGCELAKSYILDNPYDVLGGRFVGSVDHFGTKQDAPLLLVNDKRVVKA